MTPVTGIPVGLRHMILAAFLLVPGVPPAWSSSFEVGDADTGSGLKLQVHAAHARSDAGVAWTRPALTLGWGFAEVFEIAFGTGYGIEHPRDGHRQQGSQDASVALKWRFHEEDEDGQGVAWAVEPAISLPTGDRRAGMSEEEPLLSLPLRASNQIGKARVIGQLGYSHALETGLSAMGVAVLYEYRVVSDWVLGVEVLHDRFLGQDAGNHLRGNIGFRWESTQGWQLSGSLGHSRAAGVEPAQTISRIGIEYAFE